MQKKFLSLPDKEWNYDLISPFFAIRRNGELLEVLRVGCHEDIEEFYKE